MENPVVDVNDFFQPAKHAKRRENVIAQAPLSFCKNLFDSKDQLGF
jgi:hypothetical protein